MALDDKSSSLESGRNPINFSHTLNPSSSSASSSSSSSSKDVSAPSRWRRNRASVNPLAQLPQADLAINRFPKKSVPKLERTPSKVSLFNLFSKPKVEKARGHIEVGLAVPMEPQEASRSTPTTKTITFPRSDTDSSNQSRASTIPHSPSQKNFNAKDKLLNWEPPPLFQVYPQAIKYATVQACAFSPDSLLRTQSQRRLLREKMDSHRDLTMTLETVPEAKKLEKSHKRLTSNSVLNLQTPELTSKIYAIVTSGFVLQYAGEGPSDRLPEKVLQLGKESAAFASDAIPGKHWVLQISQSVKEDGTVSMAPKTSFLSRLRFQNTVVKKAATSLLLVLENAEEMDSWLTVVRKEIDSLGGMKARDEPQAKNSTESESAARSRSLENTSHRFLVQRDPHRISKLSPIDTPLQSQMSSPQIITSSWEEEQEELKANVSDSASLHSSHKAPNRKSMEASSIATSTISTEQFQLDQLRERSRHSYISSATSASGTQTRDTSPNPSPAPHSPLKEGFSPADPEPPRSAASLRSFHMNPNTPNANWRRSMQPLPATTENNLLSPTVRSAYPQRHSAHIPTSPTIQDPQQGAGRPITTPYNRPPNVNFNQPPPNSSSGFRSFSAPPSRNSTLSPPRRGPPPPPGRRQSTFGNVPGGRSNPPKPFLRPLPVRPQNSDGLVVPRRFSSLGPVPIPLGIVNRSATTPVRLGGASLSHSQAETLPVLPSQQLRRPTSMQIRSDSAPFLSSRKCTGPPARAISSTPSFVPGRRASNVPANVQPFTPRWRASNVPPLRQPPSNPTLLQQSQRVVLQKCLPVIDLPPPAPPPNMPLPPPPPVSVQPVGL